MHPHAVSHSTHMLLRTKDAPQLLTRTYSQADQLARLHTRSNAKRSQEPRHPRNVCMYGATLHQCLAPAWRLLRLTVERESERGVEHTTGCCWAREGGGGLKERGEDEARGWGWVCGLEEGNHWRQMITSLCVCAGFYYLWRYLLVTFEYTLMPLKTQSAYFTHLLCLYASVAEGAGYFHK